MFSDFFMGNRSKLLSEMLSNSIAVFFAGKQSVKFGDEFYPFSPNRNFFYLTGIDCSDCIVVVVKSDVFQKSVLFIEREDESMLRWNGSLLSPHRASELSCISEICFLDSFFDYVAFLFSTCEIDNVYLDFGKRDWDGMDSQAVTFANQLRCKFPFVNVLNCTTFLSNCRKVKSDDEIACIQNAIDVSNKGFEFLLANLYPGMYEYEAESYFDFILGKSGVRDRAFKTIAASGENAVILHYSKNDCLMHDGQLLLLDFGAMFDYYCADITRTVPVNGKFTERQKVIYNIVLKGQLLVIDYIRPGVAVKELNEVLKNFYFDELLRIGLINSKNDVDKYYFHNVSHFLGLETHDVGNRDKDILQVGNVITVEPGLYIKEESIGIRIEDDVLVTEDGCKVLSANVIKSIEDIELFFEKRFT